MQLKFVFVLIFVLMSVCAVQAKARKHVVCYHGTWATYREGDGKFDVSNIDPFLCTHLMYAFFGIEENGNLRIIDPYLDLEENYGRGNIHQFNALKLQNPTLKTFAAIGGWNEGSKNFSIVAADPQKRSRFVTSTVQFLQKYGFDGVDLDWEYPNQRHHLENNDRENFIDLVRELKEGLEPYSFMLTAAVGSAENSAAASYDIPAVLQYLDFINVMAYDLHGAWENITGLNAPLYPSKKEGTALERQLNVQAIVNYWLKHGAPKEKLVLGVPFYGRSFTLDDPQQHSPGSPHLGKGLAGKYSKEPGVLGYNELCELFTNEKWTLDWDSEQMAPYAYKGQQWIGYESLQSLELKAKFIKNNDLAGVMIWSIESDDFHGNCGGVKFPMLKKLNQVLFGHDTPSGLTERPTKRSSPYTQPTANANSSNEMPTFRCQQQKGYVRDPKNCAKYYLCDGGITYSFACPKSLYFDIETSTCNYSTLVHCVVE